MSADVVVAGVGMHPWGKWGRNFVEYGIVAARTALADAGVDYRDVQFISGADTVRNGYPGYVAGATFAQALGWTGARVASSYAACASGATALEVARAEILAGRCDVALVVGADTTPKGFLAPNAGDRPMTPTGCVSGCSVPPTRPTSRSMRGVAWPCTARPSRTSPRCAPRTRGTAWRTRTRGIARTSRSRTSSPHRWSRTRCGWWRSAPRAMEAPPSY